MEKFNILFLDDEINILNSIKRLFYKLNYNIYVFSSAKEALIELSNRDFAVIVSDYRMPEMSGAEFLEQSRKISSYSIRYLLTGCNELNVAIEAINKGNISGFISKPWNNNELVLKIKQACEKFELISDNNRLNKLIRIQNSKLKELNQNLENKVKLRTKKIEKLNADIKKSYMGSIMLLAEISKQHSKVVGNSVNRTRYLLKEFLNYFDFSPSTSFELEISAILQNIGEIGDCDNHVILGEKLVNFIPNTKNISKIIRQHHENFDGSGFPDGLKKNQIMLEARILRIINFYDETLNDRECFLKMKPNKVLDKIVKLKNIIFDPIVVDKFVQCYNDNHWEKRDAKEVEISISEIKENMIVSRDFYNKRNILLIPADTILKSKHIDKLKKSIFHNIIQQSICIYRKGEN